jgi:hypothetical protein
MERAGARVPVGPPPIQSLSATVLRRRRVRLASTVGAIAGLAASVVVVAVVTPWNPMTKDNSTNIAAESEAPESNTADADSNLPCDPVDQLVADLDVPGPGAETPEKAVANLNPGETLASTTFSNDGRTAEVAVRNSEGIVSRVYLVTNRADGWWPDGYTECRN